MIACALNGTIAAIVDEGGCIVEVNLCPNLCPDACPDIDLGCDECPDSCGGTEPDSCGGGGGGDSCNANSIPSLVKPQ